MQFIVTRAAITTAILACLNLLIQVVALADERSAFFESKIRPVLVQHCYECHSPEADSLGGKLLLDTRDGIHQGGESGAAIVAGDPESSLILQAIRYDGMEMPPDGPLPEPIVRDFEKWIRDGAYDPRIAKTTSEPTSTTTRHSATDHWAFQPRLVPQIPVVQNEDWVNSSIDFFTLSAMETAKVRPTKDAPPRTLLRRLHYDLVGLPPTMEQVERFEQACQTDRRSAIVDVVNELLASPQFGIRWARHWLDLARYGESNGDDGLGRNASFPHAWRYRNYVIDALNLDLPLNQFIIEQIAGDLLPHESAAERNRLLTATGFLAIGSKPASAMNNNFAMDIVDDQINVISTGLTGLSVACARCHDHKHDPISTRDYYALAGIFTSTKTLYGAAGNEKLTAPPTPLHQLTSKLPEPETNTIDRTTTPTLDSGYSTAVQNLNPLLYEKLGKAPVHFEIQEATGFDESTYAHVKNSLIRTTFTKNTASYSVSFWFRNTLDNKARPITAYLFSRAEWGNKSLPGDHLGIGGNHESARTGKLFVFNGNDSKQTVGGSTEIPPNTWNHVTFTRDANQVRVYLNGQPEIEASLPATFGESQDISIATRSDQFAPLEGNIGHLAIYEHAIKDSEALALHQSSGQPLGPEPIETLGFAMGVRETAKPTDCKIHINGETKKLGEVVPRGFLSVDQPHLPEQLKTNPISGDQSGRLQLARWITSDQHPLTARVLANRIWLNLMGKGIVSTPNDFGVYGATPTHPALLDHLASELIAGNWSTKQLIRSIVLSHTYQLDSRCDEEGHRLDPTNLWYTRHSRRRLDAESIRDSVLMASGTLDTTTREGSDVDAVDMLINWPPGESTNLHQETNRRSIFLCMLRHAPPTQLAAFDLPDGVAVVGQRETTTLPTQSLFFMNSDFILDQTQQFAKQLERYSDDQQKIEQIFARSLQRLPTAEETEEGIEFFQSLQRELQDEITDPLRRADRILASYTQAIMSTNEFRYVD